MQNAQDLLMGSLAQACEMIVEVESPVTGKIKSPGIL